MTVVGATDKALDLLHMAEKNQPDVILLCLSDYSSEDLDMIPKLLAAAPHSHLLLLMDEHLENQVLAMRLGAAGIVLKHQASGTLLRAIEQVSQGESWYNHNMMMAAINGNSPAQEPDRDTDAAKIESLTARELEIVRLIGDGMKNKEIASRLFISEATVRHHLTSIYGKLEVEDRLNLLIYVFQHHLIHKRTKPELPKKRFFKDMFAFSF